MSMARGIAGALTLTAWVASAGAQTAVPASLPADVPTDTLTLGAGALIDGGGVSWGSLAEGERVAVWVVSEADLGNPGATGRPVPDAPAGAVVASFAGGPPFAWPHGPVVWTAPQAGRLAFGVNAIADHDVSGSARVVVKPLGRLDSEAQRAFAAPAIALERAPGGAIARYRDRTGFGLAPTTLRFILTTSRGVMYHLSAWARPGERETFLPLPPPDLTLPPGVHSLTATVLDRIGNAAPSAEIAFDTP